MDTVSIFLGDLSYFCIESDLVRLCEPFGTVISAIVRRGKQGDTLHYAFVKMASDHAREAIRRLHGTKFMGRTIRAGLNVPSPQAANEVRSQWAQIYVSFQTRSVRLQVNEELLDTMFSRMGCVFDCVVKHYTMEVNPHRQVGYGFVYFQLQEDALRAVQHFKQQTVDGVYFDCNPCFTVISNVESASPMVTVVSATAVAAEPVSSFQSQESPIRNGSSIQRDQEEERLRKQLDEVQIDASSSSAIQPSGDDANASIRSHNHYSHVNQPRNVSSSSSIQPMPRTSMQSTVTSSGHNVIDNSSRAQQNSHIPVHAALYQSQPTAATVTATVTATNRHSSNAPQIHPIARSPVISPYSNTPAQLFPQQTPSQAIQQTHLSHSAAYGTPVATAVVAGSSGTSVPRTLSLPQPPQIYTTPAQPQPVPITTMMPPNISIASSIASSVPTTATHAPILQQLPVPAQASYYYPAPQAMVSALPTSPADHTTQSHALAHQVVYAHQSHPQQPPSTIYYPPPAPSSMPVQQHVRHHHHLQLHHNHEQQQYILAGESKTASSSFPSHPFAQETFSSHTTMSAAGTTLYHSPTFHLPQQQQSSASVAADHLGYPVSHPHFHHQQQQYVHSSPQQSFPNHFVPHGNPPPASTMVYAPTPLQHIPFQTRTDTQQLPQLQQQSLQYGMPQYFVSTLNPAQPSVAPHNTFSVPANNTNTTANNADLNTNISSNNTTNTNNNNNAQTFQSPTRYY